MKARLLSALVTCLLVGCGASSPLTFTCRATPETPTPGVPLAARLGLENTTGATVTVLGMTVPWVYRHAAHFEGGGFDDPHVLADPGEYETLVLLPGESAGGEVELADRLLDTYGRSMTEVPGTYEVDVRARLTLDPESSRERSVQATCSFEVVVPERSTP